MKELIRKILKKPSKITKLFVMDVDGLGIYPMVVMTRIFVINVVMIMSKKNRMISHQTYN
jgi:hypothetical protein